MSDRPRVYKTEGIILRRHHTGEGDSILTVLSEDVGKFQAIARGVRKAKSRMRGHVEPFMCTKLMLAHGRTFDIVTQAEVLRPYQGTREDLERTALALYCLELADRFSAERLPQPGLFALVLDVLDAIEDSGTVLAVRYFELALLALMGYEVRLDSCAVCGGRLAEEPTFFSPSAGGLVCPNCLRTAGAGRIASVRAIKTLRYASRAEMAVFLVLRTEPQLERELELAIGDFVTWVLDREPVTRRHLEDVRRLGPEVARPPEPVVPPA